LRVHGPRDAGGARRDGCHCRRVRRLVENLVATLDQFNVPKAEQEELLGLLGPMSGDIVEVESPETGTSLPASYQAASAPS